MARGGLSSKSKIRVGGPRGGVKQQIIPVNKTPAQRAAARKEFDNSIAGTSLKTKCF
jgi:hypothetical protein